MVKLLLSVKATLENVTDLEPASEDFEYFFTVKCTSCNETHPKSVAVNRKEERELSAGKGTANFVWKCGMCKREHSAKFESKSTTLPYSDETGNFAPFLTIECRGLEFIGFDPRVRDMEVQRNEGSPFTEVEFAEDDWTDYDEKAALPVGVSEFESEWSRA
ncbi:hypothetical protein DL96DRAFT_1702719 [Flagelloscypha sp. PMI_526]|nr:hypothetical protein DL96DRAFT_1702719 [Flagelloscypha sp. PMI_526]